ncbi:hypothetical protein [Actinomadura sp. 21ATH]|uniref:hypothetical protein n=1 Tax=Actinomadura sp. 21ATH TaxID=1735444 RepID=UPI0035BF081D
MTEEHTPRPQPHSGPRAAAQRHSRTLVALLAAAAVVIAVLSGALVLALATDGDPPAAGPASPSASATGARPTTVTVRGTVTMERYEDPKSQIRTANWERTDGAGIPACEGVGGFDDMAEGTSVTVYDSAGAIVAVGALEQGVPVGSRCEWAFAIYRVPDQPFYQVEVSHRGQVAVQRADAGTVALKLG